MFPGESTEAPPSVEEVDQFHRSINNFKRGPTDSEKQYVEQYAKPMVEEEAQEEQECPVNNCWTRMSFADKLCQLVQKPPLYPGEEEIDELDEVGNPYLEELHLSAPDSPTQPCMAWLSISHLISTRNLGNLGNLGREL